MDQKPYTLEDLKFVLRAISDIRDMSLSVEGKIRDLQEQYRILVAYDLCVRAFASFILTFGSFSCFPSEHPVASEMLVVVLTKFFFVSQIWMSKIWWRLYRKCGMIWF